MINCTFDSAGCMICPEIPAVPTVPESTAQQPVIGWDSGANSIDQLDGDVELAFTMGNVSGAVVGLKGIRTSQSNPNLIAHGWYFSSLAGHASAQPMESGALKGAALAHAPDNYYSVVRNEEQIVYLLNGTVVYRSSTPSTGTVLVNACLYTSGDTVGADA